MASPTTSASPWVSQSAAKSRQAALGRLVHNRVLLVAMLAGLIAACTLSFLTHAPNRLVSGTGVSLFAVLNEDRWAWAALLPGLGLAGGVFLRPSVRAHAWVVTCASLQLLGLAWLAGHQADVNASAGSPLSRTSLGGGFWCMAILAWLAASDALRRWGPGLLARTAAHAALLAPVLAWAMSGGLDGLSLFKEYANRRDVFHDAWVAHLGIVFGALAPTLLIGVPLGVAAFRHARVGQGLNAFLNVVQTIPSIALFGLLMAPLTWLSAQWPSLGIKGVGWLPAVVALTLYALLPVVHSTCAGLRQVPRAATEAAVGMGLTARQVFWKVEVPLALPLLLSGIRVTTVQTVGLAVVAALIGAGGLGAIVFQGLLSSALDLVLLGVLPVVGLAIGVNAFFELLSGALSFHRSIVRTAP